MIKSFVEILGSDVSSIQRNFVKAVITTAPLSYVVLSENCLDFQLKDFAVQCVYAIALSIIATAVNVICASLIAKRNKPLSSMVLYFTLCFYIVTACSFIFAKWFFKDVSHLFSVFLATDFCTCVFLFLASFPIIKYFGKKNRKEEKDKPSSNNSKDCD